jgi:subtilisin family serine protease
MNMNLHLTARAFTRMENEASRSQLLLLRSFMIGLCLLGGAIAPENLMAAPAPDGTQGQRILVRPREGVALSVMARRHSRLGNRILHTFPRIANLQVLELPPLASAQAVIADYQQSGLVAYAEPDRKVQVLQEPNDFRYVDGSLWGLHNIGVPGADIHAPDGWDMQNTASNIVVAVVDTGVRYTHEDLADNIWVNPGETGLDNLGRDKRTNGVDDDGDGYVDDVHGINAILGTGDPFDDHGHGSHVSGTIGGVGNNSVGVVGVCWRVQLMACKFVDSQGNAAISDAITCIDYARNKGAKIINASWGSYNFTSAALRDAINSVRDSKVIFVASAGNNANDNDANTLFPSGYEYDNIIAVAATDSTDALAWFSNFGGATVDLGAPGSPIFSCWNGSDSDYRYLDGTSMAVPHVVGACALAWAHYPNETPHQIINRILSGVDLLPGLNGKCTSGGRLNLANALQRRPPSDVTTETIWMEDDLPGGAILGADGGDSWTWVSSDPAPFSGALAHQSNIGTGIHEHWFENATNKLEVFPGDKLFAYVYLDPANPPSEVMLIWNDGCWEHRAFWGENIITYGLDQTSARLYAGPLPPVGQWVRLEVPASQLELEGAMLKGMGFTLVDGRATWDHAGRSSGN